MPDTDYTWKKCPKFARTSKNSFSKLPDFYDNFQKVAQNVKGFCFFFYFHM